MTEQLKPCPFCGTKGDLHERQIGFAVLCTNYVCGNAFTNWHKNKIDAINQWNTRADGWISIEDKKPNYGVSVLLSVNNVVQHLTYSLDGSDDSEDWFEPYGSNEDCLFIDNFKRISWMPLPSAPAK